MWIGIIIAVVCLGGFLFWMQSKKKEKEAAGAEPAAGEDVSSPQASDSFDEAKDETTGNSGLAEEEAKEEEGLKLENEAPMEGPKEEAEGGPTVPSGDEAESEETKTEGE